MTLLRTAQSLRPVVSFSGSVLLVAGAVMMAGNGDFLRPERVPWFLLGAGVASTGYVLSLFWGRHSSWLFWIVAGGLRVVLLFSEPGDDIWRYIWEGRVQLAGFSPYLHPPADPVLEGLRTPDWLLINHPEITAIYPPLTQLGLRLLAWINPATWFFKIAMVVPDLAICVILFRRFGVRKTLVYAWNPMVIYSFAGGGHFDAWFLLPLVAGWLLMEAGERTLGRENRIELAGAFLIGISVAVKWVTLPLLGWLVWKRLRKRQFAGALTLLGIGLLPFGLALAVFLMSVDGLGPLVPRGFTMVTRGCEFFPWFIEKGWAHTSESNVLPLGAIVVVSGLLMLTVRRFGRMVELLVLALILLGPSNHAWYFTWGLPFAVASKNWGTIVLSLTGFTYFRLHMSLALTGKWVLGGTERLILWGPPVVGWLTWLKKERGADGSG